MQKSCHYKTKGRSVETFPRGMRRRSDVSFRSHIGHDGRRESCCDVFKTSQLLCQLDGPI